MVMQVVFCWFYRICVWVCRSGAGTNYAMVLLACQNNTRLLFKAVPIKLQGVGQTIGARDQKVV